MEKCILTNDEAAEASKVQPVVDILRANPDARVWAYLRVSSRKQEDDGAGLDTQKNEILQYCKAKGLGEPVFVEEIASAAKPVLSVNVPGAPVDRSASPRPRLLLLLGQLTDHPKTEKHLIVYRLDRLARVAYEQEMILQILFRGSCKVYSTNASEESVLEGGADLHDPGRVLFRHMMAAFSQYERAIIQLRMGAGIRNKAAQGKWVGGRMAFGYQIKDRDLVVDATAALTVQRIFYLRRECSLSLAQIGQELATRYAMAGWPKMRVKRVLDNESLYRGIYIDPFGVRHDRSDLRILPDDWHAWLEANETTMRVPTFGDPNACL